MADSRALRRRVTALAMIPATAGVFGASVAWAGSHDPLAATSSSTAAPTAAAVDQVAVDQRVTALTAQVTWAESRIAALQATLDAQAAAAQASPTPSGTPSAPGAPSPSSTPTPPGIVPAPAPVVAPPPAPPPPPPPPAPAPVVAPPPPVHAVTKASR
jgi:hypothetical protein